MPVTWSAMWISDPLFKNSTPVDLLHKANVKMDPPVHAPELLNVHSYFRKVMHLDAPPREARIRITADDGYRLWINGQLVGEGPAPAYRFAYGFDQYDIGALLRAGENVVAVEVYYQGLLNRVWCSADFREGMSAEIVADGHILLSDDSWRVLTSKAYVGQRRTGYDTQFLEDVDARLLPQGWQNAGFDDAAWQAPIVRSVADAGYVLEDLGTPPLQVTRVHPKGLKKLASGHHLADFGEEMVGASGVKFTRATAGQTVELRHGEELAGPDAVRFQMRCNCEYRDTWILAGRANEEIQLFDYKGFRYLEILNAGDDLTAGDVWVLRRHYPYEDSRCSISADPPVLEAIWKMCALGVRNGCQSIMVDCPTREKGQYLGDALVTTAAQMVLLGDTRQTRKTILDFADSAAICPGIMAVAPGNFMQEIADFSLIYPAMIRQYYAFSGDQKLVVQLAPVLDGLLKYFAKYHNDMGLLHHVDEKWNLVDWPQNLRDEYDYDRAAAGTNAMLNALYQGCLQDVAYLMQVAGKESEAARLEAQAMQHKAAFVQVLRDAQTGLFVDAEGSAHSALHANALALLFGLAPEDGREKIVELIRKKRLSCGVFFSYFVLSALIQNGQADLACELMLSDEEHSWQTMLNAGATSCLEAWGPDQKWNTSFCHPWAAAPIPIAAHGFMGLLPGKPGYQELCFAPQTPKQLKSLAIRMNTPRGEITASHQRASEHQITYRVKTPADMPITIRLPFTPKEVTVNKVPIRGARIGDAWQTTTAIPGGEYEIVVIA